MTLILEGFVERLEQVESEDKEDSSNLVVRHGPKPKKGKDGHPVKYPPTTHLNVKAAQLKGFKLGQRVQIRVEPINKKRSARLQTLRK